MAKPKSESQSPILRQILDGGSSISFNLIKIGHDIEPQQRIFSTPSLNNVIIFKYPNFGDEISAGDMLVPGAVGSNDDAARPIETALYVPHHVAEPNQGGYAIYLRGKNYEDLLRDHFGIDVTSTSEGTAQDVKKLELIDSVPSLDAFLLKTCFETEKVAVDPRYWEISDTEVEHLRRLIRQRIEPIVRKAIESKEGGAARIERFLEAIWNPDMPEAGLFISAFGIDRSEAERIFGAWKGITFYEFQLRKIAKSATAISSWLKSKDCIPLDIRVNKTWEPQLLMYIEHVGKLLESVLTDIRAVLVEYDRCFNTFMEGNPDEFRKFLRSVSAKYWLMGFCISSLSSVVHTFDRHMQNRAVKKLAFDQTQQLLKQFEVALNRRRERTATF